jgi:hypothetical protein
MSQKKGFFRPKWGDIPGNIPFPGILALINEGERA